MVSSCVIKNCNSTQVDQIGFFRFPLRDQAATEVWLERLKNGLPEDFKLREKETRTVCARHFEPNLIRTVGRGFRLAPKAVPNFINPSPAPNGKTASKAKLNAQKPRTSALIIASLQRKVEVLEGKIRRYKKDPPDSLIFAHRHKLYKLMDRDAVILFESCLKNQDRVASERRHSSDAKALAARIYHESYETYRYMQPIFKLPSTRTIGRHESSRFLETINECINNANNESKDHESSRFLETINECISNANNESNDHES